MSVKISKFFWLILSSFLVFFLIGCEPEQHRPETFTPTAVRTFAGTAGQQGSTDDIGALARFNQPYGITTDGTNLYITDRSNRTIRQIDIATAEVTTLAGTAGVWGDADGIGALAEFKEPSGITTDGTYLYVCDKGGDSIRRIDIATAEVTTLAGGTTGDLDGIGAAAQFDEPYGIAVDGNYLYVADSANNTIRQIDIATGEVTTLAGEAGVSGTDDGFGDAARFDEPRGIFTDGTDVYVADSRNNTIRKIDLATGEVTTYAGTAGTAGSDDGTGTSATFFRPIAITSDGKNLYVADYGEEWDPVNLVYIGHYLIRQIDLLTDAVTTIAGKVGPAGSDDSDDDPTSATFYQPSGLALEGTSLFVVDRKNHTIREIY